MLTIENSDALDVEGDAILFSTNEHLYLTGGFGAALLDRYGKPIQETLLKCIRSDGRRFADTGEVFAFTHPEAPWKVLFAAVAVDPMYNSSAKIISDILKEVFAVCGARDDVSRLVTTALATGYGDMTLEKFVQVLAAESRAINHPFHVVLAHPDPTAFDECCAALSKIDSGIPNPSDVPENAGQEGNPMAFG